MSMAKRARLDLNHVLHYLSSDEWAAEGSDDDLGMDEDPTLQKFGVISLQKWVHFTPPVNHSSGVKHQKSEFTPTMSGVHSFSNSLQWSEGPKE